MSSSSLTSILFLFLCVISSSAAAVNSPPTVYDVLESNSFPRGLLPSGATNYQLDHTTGEFTVQFHGTCSFKLQGSYNIRYMSRVSGRISDGKIRDLKGISVKVLFFWFSIAEVERRVDQLEFSVGVGTQNFPVGNFLEVPRCGCGFGCPNANPIKMKLRGSF